MWHVQSYAVELPMEHWVPGRGNAPNVTCPSHSLNDAQTQVAVHVLVPACLCIPNHRVSL